MPHHAGRLGREMDEGLCHSPRGCHDCHHRPSLVPRAPLPYRLEQPQHALYRLRHPHPALRLPLAPLGREDPLGLQNLPAPGEVHHVPRHALLHLPRQRIINNKRSSPLRLFYFAYHYHSIAATRGILDNHVNTLRSWRAVCILYFV